MSLACTVTVPKLFSARERLIKRFYGTEKRVACQARRCPSPQPPTGLIMPYGQCLRRSSAANCVLRQCGRSGVHFDMFVRVCCGFSGRLERFRDGAIIPQGLPPSPQ